MGLSPFSRSSFDKKENESPMAFPSFRDNNSYYYDERKLPNPNPNRYKIIKSLSLTNKKDNYLILSINYPDCTNYEGNKILVFKNTSMKQLSIQKLIDPHFSNNNKYISPIARFRPDTEGWNMACMLCTNLLKN